MDCAGDDLHIEGVYQKFCGSSLQDCQQRCGNLASCDAFVFNYGASDGPSPTWSDACCWLKKGCSGRRTMTGKLAFVKEAAQQGSLADTDCRGSDLFIEGTYQKHCGVASLAECEAKCVALNADRPDTCRAVVYNYKVGQDLGEQPMWDDGCCWLKADCRNAVPMIGKAVRLIAGGGRPEKLIRKKQGRKHTYGPVQLSELHVEGAVLKSCDTVFVSSSPGGEGVEKLFDHNPKTKWVDFTLSPVVCELDAAVPVAGYAFTTGDDHPDRDPVAWTLEVSDDGDAWAVVDTRDAVYDLTIARNAQQAYVAGEARRARFIKFTPLRLRGEPGPPLTGESVSLFSPGASNIACAGNEVVLDGVAQQACDIQEYMCRLVCSRVASCAVYVYEPASRCCALKTSCTDHSAFYGRNAVVVRHSIPDEYFLKEQSRRRGFRSNALTPQERLEASLKGLARRPGSSEEGGHTLGAVLDTLAGLHGVDAVAAAVEKWSVEAGKEAAPEKEEVAEAAPEVTSRLEPSGLPYFAVPRKLEVPRASHVTERELLAPRRH